MKETEVKKRGWVKNAAIIFLAVMLVFTFFSNTIMNRSLPEVAAQYTTSGSITARIRESGTVTANSRFEVTIPQPRIVEEIPPDEGDEVRKGDVLIRFTGSESPMLEEARNTLRTAERALEEGIIKSDLGDNTIANAVRAVQSARNSLADAQQTLSDAQRILNGINYNEAAYNAAFAANSQAQAAKNQAQNAFLAASATTSARQYDLSIAQAELNALGPSPDDGGLVDPNIYNAAVQKVRDAQFAFDIANAASNAAADAVTAANLAASAPEAEFSIQSQNREAWISANSTVRSANSAVRDAQVNLDAENSNLSLVQKNENTSELLDSLGLRELRIDVEKAKERVEDLEKESSGSEYISPVNGIVAKIEITVNSEAGAEIPLMFIEDTDSGYSLSFTVTAEQASRVSVGDQAEVDRGWWSQRDDIRAILTNIRNNPQSPATSRILHFSISGEVESGMPLHLILNQRSESYSIIVPNSAIRTDTNGDFVLVVMSRNSPLGNRYIATRVDVNVLATDDTHSAVAGGLSGWDFVITTATAPIDPGMQVRLVDNP